MLCLFGFCIPYNVLWPLLILALKQLWDYFKKITTKNVKKNNIESNTTLGSQDLKEPEPFVHRPEFSGYIGNLKDDAHWKQITDYSAQFPGIVFLKFTATWCKSCQFLIPVLEKLEEEYQKEICIVSVDVDEFDELSAHYHAVMLPLLVAVHHGQEIKRFHGKDELETRHFVKECFDSLSS